ncbi:MAG: ATP-binding protein, partial [Microthrixaceae bacterium]|nr:ATP-binding protein [Microthrixaceae bacterium]
MELQFGIDVIRSYKRLSYTPWHAFAEFVDNSTQSYFNNQEILDKQFEKDGEKLEVSIVYDRETGKIRVSDNSIGMSEDDLAFALRVGAPPAINSGRSQFGMGLKTAACWFGNHWTVRTKRL